MHSLGISSNLFCKMSILLALGVKPGRVCFNKDGKTICTLSSSTFIYFRSNDYAV